MLKIHDSVGKALRTLMHSQGCFKRRASRVPNALETIDNETFQLIT
jgi:hypothetical protein